MNEFDKIKKETLWCCMLCKYSPGLWTCFHYLGNVIELFYVYIWYLPIAFFNCDFLAPKFGVNGFLKRHVEKTASM